MAALCALAASPAYSQTTATSDPVGFITLTVKAGSDYRMSIPMVNAPVFTGRISQITGGNTIVVDAANPFSASQFVYSSPTQRKYYYAMIASGTKEGMQLPITLNSQNSVTVSLGSNSLSGVATGAAGDQVKIFAYHSLKSLITDQTTPALPDNQVDVLTFDGNIAGVNVSASSVFTYFAGFGWYDGGTASDDVYLEPGEGVIIRNRSASDLSISVLGNVPVNKHYYLLKTLAANTPQDIPIGYIGAGEEALGSAGLSLADGDSLLVYDNAAPGFNKSAIQVITYFAGFGWYDGGTLMDNTFKLKPGFSYVLRKSATPSPTTAVWQDTPSYLPFP